MRNPNRIPSYCNKIAELWARVPDMRLGQLLDNAGVSFYTEDEDAIRKVEEFVNKFAPKEME